MNTISTNIGHTILTERRRQRLSLEELAHRSDVSKGMLSQVEQGKTNPTVALLSRIAIGLQVDVSRLLPQIKHAPRVWRVIRAEDENFVYIQTKDCKLRALSPLDLEKQIEFYEVVLDPHGKLASDPHFPGTEEILTVATGHLKVKAGERETDIRRGDSAYYSSDVPHVITNVGNTKAVAYMIVRWHHGG